MTRPVSLSTPRLELELTTLDDARLSQAQVRRFAEACGFVRTAQWQIATAASEAATNVIKHGGGGRLIVATIADPKPGLRFEARDRGPGIDDLELAIQDHVSRGVNLRSLDRPAKTDGLGTGLGAISRLMDAWGWENLDVGALLWAEKYLARRP